MTNSVSISSQNSSTAFGSWSLSIVSPLADTHDFNGDGYSDIAWRDTSTGDVAIWLMNSTTILQASDFVNVPASSNWSIVGQRDFSGDGYAELLWHNLSGDTAIWLMNGAAISQTGDFGVIPTTWTVAGTGDFNGDGSGDILWRNTSTGDVAIWLMNGTAVSQATDFINVPVASGWTIAGTGDFNGDGKTDILWRNISTGDVAIWLMNGTTIVQAYDFDNIPIAANWTIVGTGDFNGDGYSDILWRNANGDVAIWLMNGFTVSQGSDFTNVPVASGWTIAETGDFNGDGKSDILWRNTSTGDLALWLMNGAAISQATDFSNVPVGSGWTIQGLNSD
jgi:nucleoside phosphorylase